MNPHILDFIRDHLFTLPTLAKFALGMVIPAILVRWGTKPANDPGLLYYGCGIISGHHALPRETLSSRTGLCRTGHTWRRTWR
jgi:hypothetical protein